MSPAITETERQILIALVELSDPIETPNNSHYTFYPKTLEEAATYFRSLRTDWTPGYARLVENGLIQATGNSYSLTNAGAALARQERLDHPPIWYWYREYYTITSHSPAYSRFCTALYGRDLCQTDFSDIAQMDFLIETAKLKPGERVLDLGCGKGSFAEYLSDCTGARVWGLDYIPDAIAQAVERTESKRDRLNFMVGNFDHLGEITGKFDLITSIDTLYMPNDLLATLDALRHMLTPGGKMLVFYSAFCFDSAQPRDTLLPDQTDLAHALKKADLPYQTWDFTESAFHLMRRKHQLAKSMRNEFEAENTMFLYDHLMAESDGGDTPYDRQTVGITRYLYQVTYG